MQSKIENKEEHVTIFQSREYKQSRAAYVGLETGNYFIYLLMVDAYLAILLSHLGLSDAMIGIISSLISLSFLFQLLVIYMSRHLKNTKRYVLLFNSLSNFIFLSVYLLPFLEVNREVKTVLAILCILSGYLCKYMVESVIFFWGNSYVEPTKRGEFSAVKEMISLMSGIAVSLIVGYVIDYYESINQIKGGFLFIAIVMLISNIGTLICILRMKNESKQKSASQKKMIGEVLRNTLGNRNFINVIIVSVLYQFGTYLSAGFMGVYKTSELLLSVGTIQIINMAGAFFRMIFSKPFGRYSDRTSFSKGYGLALMLVVVSNAFLVFCMPDTWWLVIFSTILNNISAAGITANSYNITYSYVKAEYMVQAMAIKQSIMGVMGFVAALIGGYILQEIQENGNRFLGMSLYGQQLLCALSLIFVMAAFLYNKKVVTKQERLIQ